MNRFQSHHLLTILQTCREDGLPIDAFVNSYFRRHHALGSKDRREIARTLFGLVRWRDLLDFLLKGAPSWEKRLNLYRTIDPFTFASDKRLPLEVRGSFPKWIVDRLVAAYGEKQALAFCLTSNQKAPVTIRANLLKTSQKALLATLKKSYTVLPCQHAKAGIEFHQPINLPSLPAFKEGLFEIQDEGSQLIAAHLKPKPSDHVLDYCAGSGGKTLAFAPSMKGKGQIYLYDIRPNILIEAKKRLKRAGITNAHILTHNHLKKARFQKRMNWIFLDVPCSGSGTFRRHPDMKWRLFPKKIEALILEQRKIFAEALKFLSPNGSIVYATCSVLPEENERQIEYFTQNYPFKAIKPFFSSLPKVRGMDGFFCALLTPLNIKDLPKKSPHLLNLEP